MSCIGYYTASYAKLAKVFGECDNDSEGYKVSTEWDLETDEGISFSLYDYKETNLYREELPSVEEFREKSSYSWHICGWNETNVNKIILYLNKKLK